MTVTPQQIEKKRGYHGNNNHSSSQSQSRSPVNNAAAYSNNTQRNSTKIISPSQSSTSTVPSSSSNNNTHRGSPASASNGVSSVTKAMSLDPSMPKFDNHMAMADAYKLKVHDKIDHRDQVGRFVYATVAEKRGGNLKIHYDGWSRKWDTWSDFEQEIHRFAKAGSISKRPAHRFNDLKKGDWVDLNPTQRHPGWKTGEIRRLDQKSGQVQVVYNAQEKNFLYWAHLDNVDEIAEFASQTQQPAPQQAQNQTSPQHVYGMQKPPQQQQPYKQAQPQQQQQQMSPQQQQQQQQQQMMMGGYGGYMSEIDEMEAFARIRQKRFPRYENEEITNQYCIGDWLQVQDTQTSQWITATVTDKENNWIVVHFDGWPTKYDQKIHSVQHQSRLQELGADLPETQEEKDIKEEMANFLAEVDKSHRKLVVVDADGNCLYRCFAMEIFGDTTKHMAVRDGCCKYMRDNMDFFQNFIPDFEMRMKEKEAEYEWGDHVDITALSEYFNVRVQVFEYDKNQRKLYVSFDQGEHDDTAHLPLVLLARHRQKHYNIVVDPNAKCKRPLKTAAERAKLSKSSTVLTLRDIRLKEDAKVEEHKDDEKELDDENEDGNGDGGGGDFDGQVADINMDRRSSSKRKSVSRKDSNKSLPRMSRHNSYAIGYVNSHEFDLSLDEKDFLSVMQTFNLNGPMLKPSDLELIWNSTIAKLKKKLDQQWASNHSTVNKGILQRYWKQQFEEHKQSNINMRRWLSSLKEKNPTEQYAMNMALTTFNQVIGSWVADNLGSIVATRRRESNIDIVRSQSYMPSHRGPLSPSMQPSQPMDIDK